MEHLAAIYQTRFTDSLFRNEMWKVLCAQFFQQFINPDSTVLEIACGYCEFINNIDARHKMGVDLNPDSKKYANHNVEIIIAPSTQITALPDQSVDVIFMSNFLEHISREDIHKTLSESLRLLKPQGQLLILQPNIRFLAQDYWMFIDHITPVDDRALVELLSAIGFSTVKSTPRFLPYTTKGRLPNSLALLKLYLKIPLLHKVFGKQAFIRAIK